MPTNKPEVNEPAVPGHVALDRGVRPPLAELLSDLASAYGDDYPGRSLDAGLMQRVLHYCAGKPVEDGVSAGESGTICVTWSGAGESLTVQFNPSGQAVWAGSKDGRRPYGAGLPVVGDWACLTPNVGGEAHAPEPEF